jgi:hypothetical protein
MTTIHKSWSYLVTKNNRVVRLDIELRCGAKAVIDPPNHRAHWKHVNCKRCKELACFKIPKKKTVDLTKFAARTRAGYSVRNLIEGNNTIVGEYFFCGGWRKGYWCKNGMSSRDEMYKCDIDLMPIGG